MSLVKTKTKEPPPQAESSILGFLKRSEPEPPPEPEKKRPGKVTMAVAVAGLTGAVLFWRKRGGGDDAADLDA
ncbi:MAG TPA: hypothetical protein VLK36_09875 [Gaiellaceae bacterium]|nr:hypothetical protein [Gaiellaceae bacterium]